MNRNRLRLLLAAFAVTAASIPVTGIVPTANAQPAGPAPVPALELSRYLGTWHQLAAMPQFFNLACARDTRAEYALDPQGDVSVYNTCTTWSGGLNEIRGTATVTDPVTNAQLHVSFPSVPTQDARYGPPNYIVTALGDDYSWALVTSPNRLSGFVLSRTTTLDPQQWNDIRAAITTAGEDACWYLTTPTTGGLDRLAPLCTI